jgi:hypothetical protein
MGIDDFKEQAIWKPIREGFYWELDSFQVTCFCGRVERVTPSGNKVLVSYSPYDPGFEFPGSLTKVYPDLSARLTSREISDLNVGLVHIDANGDTSSEHIAEGGGTQRVRF